MAVNADWFHVAHLFNFCPTFNLINFGLTPLDA